jgi:hypothetical protein
MRASTDTSRPVSAYQRALTEHGTFAAAIEPLLESLSKSDLYHGILLAGHYPEQNMGKKKMKRMLLALSAENPDLSDVYRHLVAAHHLSAR